MSERTSYSPTAEEEDAANRAIFDAAIEALRPIKSADPGVPITDTVKTFLLAFAAANKARAKAENELKSAHPDANWVSYFPEVSHIVCSAYWALDSEFPGADPHSVAGANLVALIRAAKVMDAMGEALAAAEDDCSFTSYTAEDVLKLL